MHNLIWDPPFFFLLNLHEKDQAPRMEDEYIKIEKTITMEKKGFSIESLFLLLLPSNHWYSLLDLIAFPLMMALSPVNLLGSTFIAHHSRSDDGSQACFRTKLHCNATWPNEMIKHKKTNYMCNIWWMKHILISHQEMSSQPPPLPPISCSNSGWPTQPPQWLPVCLWAARWSSPQRETRLSETACCFI